jgi:methyl-accepting chemotaxis protein
MKGADYYVFFKPFKKIAVPGRSNEDLGWTVGIVYPEDDIFGDYNALFSYVLVITCIGLLLLFAFSRTVIHIQLKPLRTLTKNAQLIAQGNYNEPIASSRQKDEIGRLQRNFQKMQRALADYIGELEHLTATMRERGEELRQAYKHSQKADRMKTAFLHNMTNQMLAPAEAIHRDVTALGNLNDRKVKQDALQLVGDIQKNGNTIVELLKNLLNMSDEDLENSESGKDGKEDAHD